MSRPTTTRNTVAAPPHCQETARAICEVRGNRPDELLEIFHAIQADLGYVPDEVLPVIAEALNLSRAEVYGVLSFYHDFRRTPPGRHIVKMCRAEACQAMHTDKVCAHAEQRLGARFGETSPDGEFSLDAVYCLGNCALSPAMMIDGDLFGCVDEKRFDAIIADLDKEAAA
jgi:formate dehydrogenase subunit gamma